MDVLGLLSIISKLMLYIGALFASGTAFYCLIFETDKTSEGFNSKKMIGFFAVVGLGFALLSYFMAAAQLTGEITGKENLEMLNLLWQTPVGTALLLQSVGFPLIIIQLFFKKSSKSLMVLASFVVLGSFTQIGHVAGIPNFIFQILLLIHLIGVAFWLGVLFPLYKLSSDPTQITTTKDIAHNFGRLAIIFVPILIIAGGWLAYKIVNSFANLFTTEYGQTLLVKILIATGLLGLAAANKLRFVPALRANDQDALKHLKRSVFFEIVLVFFILSITAILTTALNLPEAHS